MIFELFEQQVPDAYDEKLAKHPRRTDLKYETFVQRCLEKRGWVVMNNDFSVFEDNNKDAEVNAALENLFDQHQFKALRTFYQRVYAHDVPPFPGHPDLLIYRPDFSSPTFVEVKGSKSDRLTFGEMLGLSLIHSFLDAEIGAVRVDGTLRSYKWAWPSLAPVKGTTDLTFPGDDFLWKETL